MDRYRFSMPIEFGFDVPGGESNPDLREQIREACEKAVQTLLQGEGSHAELYSYPVEVDGRTMEVQAWTGHMSIKHAPSRFRAKASDGWGHIAQELIDRSKNDYGTKKHIKANLIRKADVPYYVGRFCYAIRAHIAKYQYITFRQEELLRHWADEFKTKARPADPVVPTPKEVKKTLKKIFKKKPAKEQKRIKQESAWKAISVMDYDDKQDHIMVIQSKSVAAKLVMSSPAKPFNLSSSAKKAEEEDEDIPF